MGRLPWRGSCCYVTLVSEPESKWSWSCQFQWGKKGSSTASLKKGHFYFFLSCHCAKNNRRGNIEFCKEADNGASCLHHERQESSYGFAGEVVDGPPFSGLAAPREGAPPTTCLSLKNFFLLESVVVWLGPSISDGFRDSALEPSLSDSSCPARSKVMLRTCRL